MPTDRYDVVIIGGGIHGVGIAQAAAAAGHSVLLLEQSAIASGTSSRSSKLIHGGLRYLENWQFSLVRKSLHERDLLRKLAPDLIKLQPFYVPIYEQSYRRPWELRTGLSLYALLGGFRATTTFHAISRKQWDDLDGIITDNLLAVFRYWDGQTDDAALTHAVWASAQRLGATSSIPAKFLKAHLENDRCLIQYASDGNIIDCEATCLVNAAGPWCTDIIQHITPTCSSLQIELVQGTHIILEGRLVQGIYYVEAPRDRRAVFIMGWHGKTMVGTTETLYEGDPALVTPLEGEIEYLLETLAHYFPRYALPNRETLTAFAGLRVLPIGSDLPFYRPRDTVLHTNRRHKPRLLTIYGGKLTAYRSTAEQAIQVLAPSLPERRPIAYTRTLKLEPV